MCATRKGKKSKVTWLSSFCLLTFFVYSASAVTLEGTVIHKSGLITGGRSTHAMTKKWNEKDVEGGL